MVDKKKYLAYPFIYDDPLDYRCDFEILTDEISSTIGLLRSKVKDNDLREELSRVNEIMYHINASLRTFTSVTLDELKWIESRVEEYGIETKERCNKFVTPQGGEAACLAHIIRSKCKSLARLMHRYEENSNNVDPLLYNFVNLYSGYFFLLALKLNMLEGIDETEFVSRNYK
ncbi:MAG: ATP--cob(I)alamin adenosyltransferase [Clostridium sp.]|uniref:ATP:cob(I)alamin adenosyltransferase n=1 Tax=Clostridium sp. TaxID=1506 RepID=UPI002FC9C539